MQKFAIANTILKARNMYKYTITQFKYKLYRCINTWNLNGNEWDFFLSIQTYIIVISKNKIIIIKLICTLNVLQLPIIYK